MNNKNKEKKEVYTAGIVPAVHVKYALVETTSNISGRKYRVEFEDITLKVLLDSVKVLR